MAIHDGSAGDADGQIAGGSEGVQMSYPQGQTSSTQAGFSVAPQELLNRSVYTSDGRFLGKVKELDRGWFKVNAPRALDYWLPMTGIRAVVHQQVLLELDTAAVRKIRRHEPPAMARERMEREQDAAEFEYEGTEEPDEESPAEDD